MNEKDTSMSTATVKTTGLEGLTMSQLAERNAEYVSTIAKLEAQRDELLDALELAQQFISNGIELGFIRMPDPDTPDPALKTPGIIRTAIAKAKGGAA